MLITKANLPIALTWLRILAVPCIMVLYVYWPTTASGIVCATLCALASITDYFDGYFARKYNSSSDLGKLLDPVADKILVTGVLLVLLMNSRVDPFSVFLLISRDAIVGALRALAGSKGVVVPAGRLGKWKTGFQMVALPSMLVYVPIFFIPVYEIGYILLWISVLLSLISGYQYFTALMKKDT